jgi:uncharacterized protein YdeI (YjbR/CyaY-like superfamily)
MRVLSSILLIFGFSNKLLLFRDAGKNGQREQTLSISTDKTLSTSRLFIELLSAAASR